MKVAVVGAGIAGNVAARELHREHDVTVFEAGRHVGGHREPIVGARRHPVIHVWQSQSNGKTLDTRSQ